MTDTRAWEWPPGSYGKMPQHDGGSVWYAMSPNGLLANLARHDVTEHADGTITVSPSILVSSRGINKEGVEHKTEWHGYLENGVWREC